MKVGGDMCIGLSSCINIQVLHTPISLDIYNIFFFYRQQERSINHEGWARELVAGVTLAICLLTDY